MNIKLRLSVPSEAEVIAGLSVDNAPALLRARGHADAAHADLARAIHRIVEASATVDRLRLDVPAGRGTAADLEAALRAQQAAALLVSGHQVRVTEADADVAAALEAARAAVIREASRRRDELQRTADELTPVLEALRDAERALDNIVVPLGQVAGVAPVTWPQCRNDQGAS